MIHPALDQSYALLYIHPQDGRVISWNSWLIRQPKTATVEIEYSIAKFNRRFPGVRCHLMWFNPATQKNQEITLGSPLASKYALFSED